MNTCPTCDGPVMNLHPGGVLEIQHQTDCTLLPHEDATKAADYERHLALGSSFRRQATPTETILLVAQGFSVPSALITCVSHLSPGVRRRTWAGITVTEGATP